jgi:hypothetical protein
MKKSENVTIPSRARRAYQSPEFVEYGDFRMITRGAPGKGGADNKSGDDSIDDVAGTS